MLFDEHMLLVFIHFICLFYFKFHFFENDGLLLARLYNSVFALVGPKVSPRHTFL